MLTVEGLRFLMIVGDVIEHGILLLTYLRAMGTYKLTCFILRILSRHEIREGIIDGLQVSASLQFFVNDDHLNRCHWI